MAVRTPTRLPKPKVADPIILRARKDGPELVARPCSGKHRQYFLSGYLVLSCGKCSLKKLDDAVLGGAA